MKMQTVKIMVLMYHFMLILHLDGQLKKIHSTFGIKKQKKISSLKTMQKKKSNIKTLNKIMFIQNKTLKIYPKCVKKII